MRGALHPQIDGHAGAAHRIQQRRELVDPRLWRYRVRTRFVAKDVQQSPELHQRLPPRCLHGIETAFGPVGSVPITSPAPRPGAASR